MAITARELVFYIRAEDQASRVVKRAAANMRGMTNLRGIQAQIDQSNLRNIQKIQAARDAVTASQITGSRKIGKAEQAIDDARLKRLDKIGRAQQAIRQNATAITAAEQRLLATPRTIAGKTPLGAYSRIANPQWQVAAEQLATLNRESELLQARLAEVERTSTAAAAALERDLVAIQAQATETTAALRAAQTEVARLAYEEQAANERMLASQKLLRTQQIISGFQSAARAARLFGLAVGVALGYAAHQAANFQTELTLAATQARPIGAGPATTARISGQLQDVVLAQMQKFPAASKEMADSLYQIFSSTKIQNIGAASKMLELFNKAAVAGGTDLKSMTDAGITLLNNFVGVNNEFKTLNPALNRFFAAVRYGRMNAGQFAGSLSYVAGMAKEAGLGFTDVADAMAVLTRQTGARGTTRDAQGLGRLIQQFANPDFIAGAKKLGVQVIDPITMKMKPLLQIIGQIRQKADLRGVNALNFFKTLTALGGGGAGNKGTVQAQRAFAFLVNNYEEYVKVSKQVNSDNNELQQSFAALSKSPGVAWQIMLNQIKAAVIVIGREAIPAFVKLSKPLIDAIKWFNGLSEASKKNIAQIGVYGAAILVLGGTIVILAGAVSKLFLTLRLLKLTALGAEAGSSRSGIMLLIGALVALGYILAKHPEIIKNYTNAIGGFRGAIATLVAALAGLSLVKLISSMGLLAISAENANKKVLILRNSLIRLGLIVIPAIVIPVVYNISTSLGKGAKVGDPRIHYGGGLTGLFARAVSTAEYGIDRFRGMTPSQARADVYKDIQKGGGLPGASVVPQSAFHQKDVDLFLKILNRPELSPYWYRIADAAYKVGDTKTLQKVLNAMTVTAHGAIANRRNYMAPTPSAAAVSSVINSAPYMKALQNVARLQNLYQADPTPSLAKYKKYTQALNALNAKYNSDLIKGYTQDYLAWAAQNAKKTRDIIDTGSQALLNSRIDSVLKLKKAYDLSHTYADAKKYYAALTKLNKMYASDVSQSYINDYISRVTSATSEVVDKGSDALLNSRIKAVEKLKQAYDMSGTLDAAKKYFAAYDQLNTDYASQASQDFISNALNALAIVDKGSAASINRRIKDVAKLKKAYDLHGTLANSRAYFTALNKLNADYASQASQDYISRYLDKIDAADKKRLDLIKQNRQNAITLQKDLVSGIQQIYDNFLQQNQTNMGDLFQGPWMQGRLVQTGIQFGFKPRGIDILHDAKAQLFQYRRFNRDLSTLAKRGAPKALIDAFQAMGPAQKSNIEALMKLEPSKWHEYLRVWRARQGAIKKTTMSQLNAQLGIYEAHGKKIAIAIIKGIQSENVKLTGVFETMIEKMFPGLARQARPHGGHTQNVNNPRKVSENIHFHLGGHHVTAEDRAAVKKILFRMQNG